MRGKAATGAARLGGLYEMGLHGVHNLREGASAVGSAVGMASCAWRLAKDGREDTPEEKRLTEAQVANQQFEHVTPAVVLAAP